MSKRFEVLPRIRFAGLNFTSLGKPTRTRVPAVFNSDKYGSNGISPEAVSIMKSKDLDSVCIEVQDKAVKVCKKARIGWL